MRHQSRQSSARYAARADGLDLLRQRVGNPRRALEQVERIRDRVPEPLRFVAVDRRCARGQHVEAQPDDGQAACLVAVADDGDGELAARAGRSRRAPAAGRWRVSVPGARDELRPVRGRRSAPDALARPLEARLRRRAGRAAPRCGHRPAMRAMMNGAVGTPCCEQDLLRAALVEAERERERVGGVVGNPVELADRRDVPLAVRAVEPLGDVEHEVGPGGAEPLGEALGGLEADHLADGGERRRDGVDRAPARPTRRRGRAARDRCGGVRPGETASGVTGEGEPAPAVVPARRASG